MTAKANEKVEEVEVEAESVDQEAGQISERRANAGEIISSSVKWSAAAGLIPMPYLDVIGLGAVQVQMVMDITRLYEKQVQEEAIRGSIAALLGTIAPAGLSGAVAGSSVKLIPVIGTLVGGLSLSALGAASTYAVGKVFVEHFEKGGTLANFSVDSVKDEFKKAFEKKSKTEV
jgi:uncharacterized protein (DUF697 family)